MLLVLILTVQVFAGEQFIEEQQDTNYEFFGEDSNSTEVYPITRLNDDEPFNVTYKAGIYKVYSKDYIVRVTSSARTVKDNDIRDIDYIYAKGTYYERGSSKDGWTFKWSLEDSNYNAADAQIEKTVVFPDKYQRVVGKHKFVEKGYTTISRESDYIR